MICNRGVRADLYQGLQVVRAGWGDTPPSGLSPGRGPPSPELAVKLVVNWATIGVNFKLYWKRETHTYTETETDRLADR